MAISTIDLQNTEYVILPHSISITTDEGNDIPLSECLISFSNPAMLMDYYYPIGFIVESDDVTFDPNGIFPGEWIRFGEGRTKIGCDNDTLLETSIGEFTHLLTTQELPNHTHYIGRARSNRQINNRNYTDIGDTNTWSGNFYTGYTGGDVPHNNIQPYYISFSWKRVA